MLARAKKVDGVPLVGGAWPILGHIPHMYRDLLGWVRRSHAKHGPLFYFQVGDHYQLLVGEEVGFDLFKNKVTGSDYLKDDLEHMLGNSLLVHDGPTHRRMRRTLNKPFTPKGLTAARVGEVAAEVVDERITRWSGDVPLLAETRDLALDIIFRIIGIDGDVSEWRQQYERFAMGAISIGKRLPGSPAWRSIRAARWLDDQLRPRIQAARELDPDTSLLTAMVHATDDDGNGLPEKELLDNVRLLAFAGHETTASVMAWMALYLAEHPEHWDRLVDEAGDAELPRTPKDLARFPFTEALFREALRLHPPVGLASRVVHGQYIVHDYEVPVGTIASCCISNLSRNPERYEEADHFRPQRWMGDRKHPSPIELAQFGGGPHFCLGYHLAWLEGVQFGVALARHLKRAPTNSAGLPKGRQFPLARPPYSAVLSTG